MKYRILVAVLLLSALLLGPVHADANADVRAALVLVDLSIDSFRSVLFHTPTPNVAFAYKSDELFLLDKHLVRLALEGQMSVDATAAVASSMTQIKAISMGVPHGELTAEQVVEWQTKVLAALKQLRASLRKP